MSLIAITNIDRSTLEYVVRTLDDSLGKRAEVLFDVHVRYGGDFTKFMETLDSVDVVIIILTPMYRQKVLERRGGVYEEYTRIWNRYINREPATSSEPTTDRFEIVPILFSGALDTSTPEEIKRLKQLDLTGLRVSRKPTGEFVLPHHVRAIYGPTITELACQIHAVATVSSPEFAKLSESFYDRLFVDLKANVDDPAFAGNNYLNTILVKTHAYRRIASQLAFVVIGRKGSGKSTLTQVLPLVHPERYEGIIRIIADEFNLQSLYALYSDQQFRSDVTNVVPRDRAFALTWEALLMLATMNTILTLDNVGALNHLQKRQVPAIRLFMEQLIGQSNAAGEVHWRPGDLFNFAFDATMRFVRDCIEGSRDDATYFLTDIGVRFNRDRYLEFIFGKDLLITFRTLAHTFTKNFWSHWMGLIQHSIDSGMTASGRTTRLTCGAALSSRWTGCDRSLR